MSENGQWCLIESDPGIFTEMLHGFGVKGLQVEEIFCLDDIEKTLIKPVYGLVFLFKWREEDKPCGEPSYDPNIFFARQVIQNSCATQAIINMLMNISDPEVQLGKILTDFKDFTKEFDPDIKGLSLTNSEEIRAVHNSFARPTVYELDTTGGKSEDNYHFITYIPVGNKILELDGLRQTPLVVAELKPGDEWMDVVRPAIHARIKKYSEGEIHFNLMAVIPDRKQRYTGMLNELIEANADGSLNDQINDLKRAISEEEYRAEMWKKENARRRHNYLPFLIELMRCLAREGKLVPIFNKAITTAKERAGMLSADKTMLELKRKQ